MPKVRKLIQARRRSRATGSSAAAVGAATGRGVEVGGSGDDPEGWPVRG